MTRTYPDLQVEQVAGLRVYHTPRGPYPSITTVLGRTLEPEKQSSLESWRQRIGTGEADAISTAAATRGTNMHLMLERAVRGDDPQVERFPPEHAVMFRSLRYELRKINNVSGQEVALYSDVLGVAGRCDLVAEHEGELAIIDYKSSTRPKAAEEIGDYFLQAAFYGVAHDELFGTRIKKLVIMMAVEHKIPLIFKHRVDDDLLLKLSERVCKFYGGLYEHSSLPA